MTSSRPRRSGAQVLIDQLRIHGTDTIFGVPGDTNVALYEALRTTKGAPRRRRC